MGIDISGEVYNSSKSINPAPQISVSPTIVGGSISVAKDDISEEDSLTTIGLKGIFAVITDQTGQPVGINIGLTFGAKVSPSMGIEDFAVIVGNATENVAESIASLIQGAIDVIGQNFSSNSSNEEVNGSKGENAVPADKSSPSSCPQIGSGLSSDNDEGVSFGSY